MTQCAGVRLRRGRGRQGGSRAGIMRETDDVLAYNVSANRKKIEGGGGQIRYVVSVKQFAGALSQKQILCERE